MRLLQMASGRGRIPAVEVLIGTPTMKKLIYEGRTLELLQYIEDGQHFGMQSFNQSLIQLWREGKVRYEDALANATSPDEFRMMAEGIGTGTRKKEL
jgi:twitching motility protein PilU